MLMRSLLAAALFAAFALLATARGETILSIHPSAPFGPPLALDSYSSFGVWGVSSAAPPTAEMMQGAQVGSVLQKFGPEETAWQSGAGSGLFQYTLDGGSFSGGIAAVPLTGSPAGTVIDVTLQPETFPSQLPVAYNLWIATGLSRGVWAEALDPMGGSGGEIYLPALFYGTLRVVTGENATIRLTMDGGGNPDDGTTMVLGAVTAAPHAVPEPGLFVVAGLLAIAYGWYRAVLWFGREYIDD